MKNTAKLRAAAYALGGALFAVAGVYGLVTQEQTAAWLNVLAAVLAVLAFVNVPSGGGDT
jgi:drug/metabolite transporter (DMT)-like permease